MTGYFQCAAKFGNQTFSRCLDTIFSNLIPGDFLFESMFRKVLNLSFVWVPRDETESAQADKGNLLFTQGYDQKEELNK